MLQDLRRRGLAAEGEIVAIDVEQAVPVEKLKKFNSNAHSTGTLPSNDERRRTPRRPLHDAGLLYGPPRKKALIIQKYLKL